MRISLTYLIGAPDELTALDRGAVLEDRLREQLRTSGRLGRLAGSPELAPKPDFGLNRTPPTASPVAKRSKREAGAD